MVLRFFPHPKQVQIRSKLLNSIPFFSPKLGDIKTGEIGLFCCEKMCVSEISNIFNQFITIQSSYLNVQCVPIKRKPVLSLRYLYCHSRMIQTQSFINKKFFFLVFHQINTKKYDISMH